jgi:hypothetical protein
MNDKDPAVGITNGNGGNGGSMSVTEVTGLVNLFNGMLLAMEGRLITKMDDNSRMAEGRWARHDADSKKLCETFGDRFERIETVLKTTADALQEHLDKEHDEELRAEERVKPVKTIAQYVGRNWRTILLLIVSLLAVLGFSFDTLSRVSGFR